MRRRGVSTLDNHVRDRILLGVRDGEADTCETECGQLQEDFTRSGDTGSSEVVGNDIDVLPREFSTPACSQRLEESLLGGVPARKTLILLQTLGSTVGDLLFSEHALEKTRRSFERLAYAIDFNDVGSNSGNHGFSEK